MTTEVISHVGSAASWAALTASEQAYYTDTGGSNYTTPQLWDTAYGNTDGNLTANDQIVTAELNGEDFIGALSIGYGWTTDATHYPVIRARVDSEYDPVTDTGAKIFRNANYGITVNSTYVRFQRVRLGSYAYNMTISGNLVDCMSCTILSSDINSTDAYSSLSYSGCVVLFADGSGTKLQNVDLRNCTIIGNNSLGLMAIYGTAYNTAIYNNSAALSFPNFYLQTAGDYNAESVSDQAAPPGANSIINLPSSAFKDFAGGDYRLSGVDSPLYHAGSSAYAPELDNSGVPFDTASPSIGAFEFIAPRGPTSTSTPPAFKLMNFRPQQGDVSLFQSDDGGDITALDGIVTMSGGLGTAVYLSLFGGNEDDDGRQDSPTDWWGNIDETDPAREYHSETQHLLRSLPATTGNLRRLEDAARRDLSWLESSSAASSVTVSASIPGVNRIKLEIDIEAIGEESSFEYVENWKASA